MVGIDRREGLDGERLDTGGGIGGKRVRVVRRLRKRSGLESGLGERMKVGFLWVREGG
jgi:hypothetical protein